MGARVLAVALVLAALAGCGGLFGGGPKTPPNLSEVKAELRDYHLSGRYAADVSAAIAEARRVLGRRAAPKPGQKLAIVLDVDETALSNMQAIQANDYGFIAAGPCALPQGPCGWDAWIARAEAPAMAPTLELAREAQAQRLALIFISHRSEKTRAATERNLQAAGYANWTGLVLRPDDSSAPNAAYKGPARCRLEAQGWTIVLNVGDQPSDVQGACQERHVLLPNPFYRVP
ncbi:MAG: acid phosphatase [Alphaproteobacteria bacterium]|nr:acid phosphatase [Alphaproteobacteria bacterium]